MGCGDVEGRQRWRNDKGEENKLTYESTSNERPCLLNGDKAGDGWNVAKGACVGMLPAQREQCSVGGVSDDVDRQRFVSRLFLADGSPFVVEWMLSTTSG